MNKKQWKEIVHGLPMEDIDVRDLRNLASERIFLLIEEVNSLKAQRRTLKDEVSHFNRIYMNKKDQVKLLEYEILSLKSSVGVYERGLKFIRENVLGKKTIGVPNTSMPDASEWIVECNRDSCLNCPNTEVCSVESRDS